VSPDSHLSLSSPIGTVVAVQANFYQVRLDSGVELLCTRRTLLKKIGIRVMVGDRAIVAEPDWQGGRGAISEVLPRNSELDRPPIANATQILLVFALAEPDLDPYLLSKFLIKAESTGLQVILCLNKSDLVSDRHQQEWHDRLQSWGYEPIFISVETGRGIDELQAKLAGQITVCAGHSGVGKSSLTNALIPDLNLRVSRVSGKLNRGRHTTRHVELFTLPKGGLIADTPGFNQPELNCLPEELGYYFPEIRDRLTGASCQFNNCLHRDEPNCVVKDEWERYPYYLDFLIDAIAHQEQRRSQPNPESNLKRKNRADNQQFEPKLELKKYRQISRRTQNQTVEED
jgi:ribosome biogenesis GTPase / thiamine phosphate phosphatase